MSSAIRNKKTRNSCTVAKPKKVVTGASDIVLSIMSLFRGLN